MSTYTINKIQLPNGDICNLKDDKAPRSFFQEGQIITLENCGDNYPLNEFKIQFSPVQFGSGDPSSNNIRPIIGAQQAIITVCKKNLFDQSQLTACGFVLDENGYYTGTRGQFISFFAGFPKQICYKQNTRYTLSFYSYNGEGSNVTYIDFVYTDGTTDRCSFSGTTPTLYTSTSAANKTIQYLRGSYGSVTGVIVYIKDIMLVEGTAAASYQPYQDKTYNLFWNINKNLFDEQYIGIQTSSSTAIRYRSFYVGNNIVTLSTDMPLTSNSSTNLFIGPGITCQGLTVEDNGVALNSPRTVQPINGFVTIGYRNYSSVSPEDYNVQLQIGDTATTYEPYNNYIYGGELNVLTGELTITKAGIIGYAGETLPGAWISDRDIYAENTTPTTGAQVVYDLAQPITYQLSSVDVRTFAGFNNIGVNAWGNLQLSYSENNKLLTNVYNKLYTPQSATIEKDTVLTINSTSTNVPTSQAVATLVAEQIGTAFIETITGTDVTIVGQPNTRYNCGTLTALTITPPNAGTMDVIFTSGTTPTVLTVSGVKWPWWFEPTVLSTNTIYELLITDGTLGSVMSWDS